MRYSLSFITGTSLVSCSAHGTEGCFDPGAGGGGRVAANSNLPGVGPHILDPLGHDPVGHQIYLLEHFDDESGALPQLHCIHTRGPNRGRMVPVRSWYQGERHQVEKEFEPRLADLCARLQPLVPASCGDFELSTRVVRRRAQRLSPTAAPIRKYLLRLTVRSADRGLTSSLGVQAEVTAYLRPHTRLAEVLTVTGEPLALAVVSYVGVPYELGYDKNVGLLVPVAR